MVAVDISMVLAALIKAKQRSISLTALVVEITLVKAFKVEAISMVNIIYRLYSFGQLRISVGNGHRVSETRVPYRSY